MVVAFVVTTIPFNSPASRFRILVSDAPANFYRSCRRFLLSFRINIVYHKKKEKENPTENLSVKMTVQKASVIRNKSGNLSAWIN